MKLFLYSYAISSEQADGLTRLVGKEPERIMVALIENAADVIIDSRSWVEEGREMLRSYGYQVEPVDLRDWRDSRKGLREKLASKDVIWLGGGNTFYLRWLLKETGADSLIVELAKKGRVYAGWSAGAIVAGPTLHHFEVWDNARAAPEVIVDGLGLTETVVVPHIDDKDSGKELREIDEQLQRGGYTTAPLGDTQALVINGDEQKVI